MTLNVLLVGMSKVSDLRGFNVRIDEMNWDFITPLQKYDMAIVDNSSINSSAIRVATKMKNEFLDFVSHGGILICLSARPKNYSGYSSYAWLPLPRFESKVSKLQIKNLKVKSSVHGKFVENQKNNIVGECGFDIQNDKCIKIIATTGLEKVIAFSIKVGSGRIIFLPQFKDKSLFLKNWLKFWAAKMPEWLEKFQYREKGKLLRKLKVIGTFEKLLYANDRELKDAVIEAFRILGFSAHPAGEGTEQDINLSCNSFKAIVEVKGLKSCADRDDMRSLLDYYDVNVSQQPNLKGIFVVNHYREVEPGNRGDPYTPGALDLAKRKKFCLLTADNFYFVLEKVIAKPELKNEIKQKIIMGSGLVRLQLQ